MVLRMGRPEPLSVDEPHDAEEEEADAEGWADHEAGRVISNEAVMRWVRSWGTDNPLPPPEVGD